MNQYEFEKYLSNYSTIKETLNKYNKPYILVSGSKSNRLETAIKEINKLLDI